MEKEKCYFCGKYFGESQLSSFPNEFFRFNRKYCLKCFPEVFKEYTEQYHEHECLQRAFEIQHT